MPKSPAQHRRENRRLLETLEKGDKLKIVDHRDLSRRRKVHTFWRVDGDTLVATDATGRERKYALGLCSCFQYGRPGRKKKEERAA